MIPCPVDCEMSDWTVWSDCPAKCGAGVQTRYRSIRRLPSAGGRQCPSLGSKSKVTFKNLKYKQRIILMKNCNIFCESMETCL